MQKIKQEVNYFPVNDDMLNDAALTPAQFKILCVFCKYYNPLLKYNHDTQKPINGQHIADLSRLSLSTIKTNLEALIKLRPQNFVNRRFKFAEGFIYHFRMEISQKTSIAIEVETDHNLLNPQKPIADTQFSEHDLAKMQILELTGFSATELTPFLRYSEKEIRLRVAYIVDQQKKRRINPRNYKYPKIYLKYIQQCFDDQWMIPALTKEVRKELLENLDARLNPLLDEFVSRTTAHYNAGKAA
jgi:DNA-binding MarR family transcriptional regulator